MKIVWKQQAAWMSVVYGYSWPIYILTEYIRTSLSPDEDLADICSVLRWSCIDVGLTAGWMQKGKNLSTSTVFDLCPTFLNFPNSFTC